jgi:transient receptor potential cation channel subfamily C protein 2
VNKKLKFPPTLLRAIQEGQLGLVQQLLESSSDASGAGPGGPLRNVEESEDRSWREALNLAIRLGHEVITDVLLANVKFDFRQIHEALLVAVDTNQPAVVRRLLARLEREKGRKVDTKSFSLAFFDSSIDGSRFAPGVTPLTLACQKDLYEIAQLLMDQGHTIARPHPVSCACLECSNARRYDLLKFSLSRINTYRGIASRAHLSLASEDAMLAAFQLSRELRRLARKEPEFKVCYPPPPFLNSILPSVPCVCCCTGTGLGFVVAVVGSLRSGKQQAGMEPLVLRTTILSRTDFHSSDSHLCEE